MKKKLSKMLLLILIMPFILGAGMKDTNINLPPSANFTTSYYEPKFITFLVVSDNQANTADITSQIQALQATMQPQNVTIDYQIFTSAAFATQLPNNQINYKCYGDKYFVYYSTDTTCLTSTIQNFLYTEGFTMQAISSSSQYTSINSGGFFSGNGGGGYYATSNAFISYVQTKEANPLVAAGTQGTLYNPSMVSSSSFTPTCTVQDQQGSNLTITYTIKDANSNVKSTGSQSVTSTSSLHTVTFPAVDLKNLPIGKYTITFETFSNPAITPVTSDPKYTATTNVFYNAHGSNYLVTDEMEVYSTSYSDPANFNIMAKRWMFTQSNIFNPNQGSIDNNRVYIASPLSKLNKSGSYQISYGVQDQPITPAEFPSSYNLFSNFFLWSTQTNQFSTTVVNRPMALGTANLTAIDGSHYSIAITDNSYDLDHLNDSGKGIALVNYKWKQQGTLPWNTGLPSTISAGLVYEVQMQALSVDGIWSFPYQLLIGAKNPPVAQFTIANNPMTQGTTNTITDTSYTPNVGYAITQRNWYVLDTNYNVLQNCGTTQPNLSTLAVGNYKIEEIVQDGTGLWSLPCYRDLTVVPNIKLVNFRVTNMVNPPSQYTFPILQANMPVNCKAGYNNSFQIDVQGQADSIVVTAKDSNNNNLGTINMTKISDIDSNDSVWGFDYATNLNTPPGTIINFNITGYKGSTSYNYNNKTPFNGDTLKVIDSALSDTIIYRRY